MIRICFHGAESTGKSVLAAKLQTEYGWPVVAEYGRTYAEQHGTDFTMQDLLAMAEGQDAMMQAALKSPSPLGEGLGVGHPQVLILDTDPLMTAAWAMMLFDDIPPVLMHYPKADHYLLFSPDVAWQEDGTRMFGTAAARAKFAALAEEMLVRTGVAFTRIGGDWAVREAQVVAAIHAQSRRC